MIFEKILTIMSIIGVPLNMLLTLRDTWLGIISVTPRGPMTHVCTGEDGLSQEPNHCLFAYSQLDTLGKKNGKNNLNKRVLLKFRLKIPVIELTNLDPHWCLFSTKQQAPSNYLNQCWLIIKWTFGKKMWNCRLQDGWEFFKAAMC